MRSRSEPAHHRSGGRLPAAAIRPRGAPPTPPRRRWPSIPARAPCRRDRPGIPRRGDPARRPSPGLPLRVPRPPFLVGLDSVPHDGRAPRRADACARPRPPSRRACPPSAVAPTRRRPAPRASVSAPARGLDRRRRRRRMPRPQRHRFAMPGRATRPDRRAGVPQVARWAPRAAPARIPPLCTPAEPLLRCDGGPASCVSPPPG